MSELLAVGIGGFIGSCFRYILTKLTFGLTESFPLGTLLSNVIAGFFIGFIIGLEQNSVTISKRKKLFLTTGLMGGLSTFSTFSIETIDLFQSGKYILSVSNVLLNLVLSFIGVLAGLAVAKALIKHTA